MFLTEKEESLNEILYLLNYLNNLIIENVNNLDDKYECNISGELINLNIYELLQMIINDYNNIVLKDYYDYLG